MAKYRRLLAETEASDGRPGKHRSFSIGVLEKGGQKPVPVVYISARMPKSAETHNKTMKYRAATAPKNIDEYKFSARVTGFVRLDGSKIYIKTIKKIGLGPSKVASLSRLYFKALGSEPPFHSVYFQNITPSDFADFVVEPSEGESAHEVAPEDREFPASYEPFDEAAENQDTTDEASEPAAVEPKPAAPSEARPALVQTAGRVADRLLEMAAQAGINVTIPAAELRATLVGQLQTATAGMSAEAMAEAADELALRLLLAACSTATLEAWVADAPDAGDAEWVAPRSSLRDPASVAQQLFDAGKARARQRGLGGGYDIESGSADRIRALLAQRWPRDNVVGRERSQLIGRLIVTIAKAFNTSQGLLDILQPHAVAPEQTADRPAPQGLLADNAAHDLAAALMECAQALQSAYAEALRQKDGLVDTVETRFVASGLVSVAAAGGSWDLIERAFTELSIHAIVSQIRGIATSGEPTHASIRAIAMALDQAGSVAGAHAALFDDLDASKFASAWQPGKAVRDGLAKASADIATSLAYGRHDGTAPA